MDAEVGLAVGDRRLHERLVNVRVPALVAPAIEIQSWPPGSTVQTSPDPSPPRPCSHTNSVVGV